MENKKEKKLEVYRDNPEFESDKAPIPLICQRCKHAWNYLGNAEYWTSCPYCKTSVSVRQKNKVGKDANKSGGC